MLKKQILILITLFLTFQAYGNSNDVLSEISCNTTGEAFGGPTDVNVTISLSENAALIPVPTKIVAVGTSIMVIEGVSQLIHLTDQEVILHFSTEHENEADKTIIDIQLASLPTEEGLILNGLGHASIIQRGSFNLKPGYELSECSGLLQ